MLFCSILAAVGQIFLKMGASTASTNIVSWVTNIKLIIGLSLYALSSIFFIYALRLGNVSLLYPVIATSYIWVAILATMFLGESFPLMRWAGIGLIIGGIVLIIR